MANRNFTYLSGEDANNVLYDGVPDWMRGSLVGWTKALFRDTAYPNSDYADISMIRRVERKIHKDLVGTNTTARAAMQSFIYVVSANPELHLDIIDASLQLGIPSEYGERSLEVILSESGSKWTVGSNDSNNRLQERVDQAVQDLVKDISQSSNKTMGEYIKEAWVNVYGRNPDNSKSYGSIIKAIEAASWLIITPNDNRATLGTIIKELKNHTEDYSISITEKQTNNGISAVINDLQLIWEGQTDRHGTANPITPTTAATEEAVSIGLSLCQRFERKLILKK